MREADLCLAVLPRNFKTDLGIVPLIFDFRVADLTIQHMPDDCLARDELGNLHFAPVYVPDRVRELAVELISVAFNFSRPPSTNILDGLEDFLRSLVYRKCGAEIL